MRPATRRQIEILNLNQTQLALARRLLSQGQFRSFARFNAANRNLAILPNDIVCEFYRTLDDLGGRIAQVHVNLTRHLHHSKTFRWRIEELDKGLR
jgi:hypothetical protein